MSLLNFLGREKNKQKQELQPTLFDGGTHETDASDDQNEPLEEGTPVGVKLKIVAALLIVGVAGYVGFWVQSPSEIDPSQIKTDVLNNGSEAQTTQANGQTQQISITDFSFDPSTLHVEKGTTVVWTNKDAVPHNITADSFSSGTLNSGDTFSYTFDKDGIYDYHCSFHPQMTGSIMVGDTLNPSEALVNDPNQNTSTEALKGAADEMSDPMVHTQSVLSPLDVSSLDSTEQNIVDTQSSVLNQPAIQNDSQETQEQAISSNDTQVVSSSTSDSQHGAAVEPLNVSAKKILNATQVNKISSSGPEDYLYLGVFGVILFLNRKKLLKLKSRS